MNPSPLASPLPPDAVLLTLDQVAALLQVSKRTVQRLVREGELQAIRLGHRTVRLSAASIHRFIDGEPSERDRRRGGGLHWASNSTDLPKKMPSAIPAHIPLPTRLSRQNIGRAQR
jgi:excisionase family DNA binding protein